MLNPTYNLPLIKVMAIVFYKKATYLLEVWFDKLLKSLDAVVWLSERKKC